MGVTSRSMVAPLSGDLGGGKQVLRESESELKGEIWDSDRS